MIDLMYRKDIHGLDLEDRNRNNDLYPNSKLDARDLAADDAAWYTSFGFEAPSLRPSMWRSLPILNT
jgi:hypothetical protein